MKSSQLFCIVIVACVLFVNVASAGKKVKCKEEFASLYGHLKNKIDTSELIGTKVENGTCFFTPDDIHNEPELKGTHIIGTVLGFSVLAIFWVFTFFMIVCDELKRHRKYSNNLADASKELERLGLDPAVVDEEFKNLGKAKKEEDE